MAVSKIPIPAMKLFFKDITKDTSSDPVPASTVKDFTFNVADSNGAFLGCISTWLGGTGSKIALVGVMVPSTNTVQVRVQNLSGSSVSMSNIIIRCMYAYN